MIVPSAADFLGREIISDSLRKIIPEECLGVDGGTRESNVKPLPQNERSNTHLQIRVIRELVQIPCNSENILICSGRLVPGRIIQRK